MSFLLFLLRWMLGSSDARSFKRYPRVFCQAPVRVPTRVRLCMTDIQRSLFMQCQDIFWLALWSPTSWLRLQWFCPWAAGDICVCNRPVRQQTHCYCQYRWHCYYSKCNASATFWTCVKCGRCAAVHSLCEPTLGLASLAIAIISNSVVLRFQVLRFSSSRSRALPFAVQCRREWESTRRGRVPGLSGLRFRRQPVATIVVCYQHRWVSSDL